MHTRRKVIAAWTIISTVLVEAATLYLRFRIGIASAEYNRTAPLPLQIHHMFWSVPFFPIAALLWRYPKLSGSLLGIAAGLIFSDLLHHFVILPFTVGNMGWHWP